MKTILLFSFLILYNGIKSFAQQQPSTQLSQDTGRHYYFQKDYTADGKAKKVLYQKAKAWVLANLDPADNYLFMDEVGNDSISTMAFITVDDLPEVQNQVFSFKILLDIEDGVVHVHADKFLYTAMNKTNGDQYDQPLENLKGLNPATQSSIIFAFDKKFDVIIQRLQKSLH